MQSSLNSRECNIKYCLLQSANMFVSAILSAFLIPLLVSQGFNSFEIGILIAVKCVSMIIFSNVYAVIADKLSKFISNKEFIKFFCISGILVTLVHFFIPMNMISGILVFGGYGATFSCICTFTDSLSSQYTAAGVKINYVLARSAGSLFFAIAGAVLGYVTSMFDANVILLLQIGALLICFIVTMIMPDPNKYEETTEKKVVDTSSILQMLYDNPFYTIFLVASLIFMTGINITMSYMAYSVEYVGGSNFELGITTFLLGMCEVFVALYFSKFLKIFRIRKLVLVAMIGMSLRVLILVVATNMMHVYIAQLFELIGCMLWAGNILLVQEEILEKNKVKGITLISSVQTGFSVLTASLLGGYIMERFQDAFYLHLFAFICTLIGILMYMFDIIFFKQKKKFT